ncbi:MAG: nucleotidyltransferase domain-containing protein [Bdellovibrionales bacterium]
MLTSTVTGLPQEVQIKLNSVFKKYPKIEKVVLYGSRAKGNYKKASDIDLTAIGAQMSLSEFFKLQNEIDDLLLPYKVDLSLFHDLDNENLIDHIKRIGLVFYEANN